MLLKYEEFCIVLKYIDDGDPLCLNAFINKLYVLTFFEQLFLFDNESHNVNIALSLVTVTGKVHKNTRNNTTTKNALGVATPKYAKQYKLYSPSAIL